jgi:hypothetical protein
LEFVELAKEAFVGWRQLEQESGQQLLELNGLLELVESAGQSSRDALDAAGAEYELLDAPGAQSRWPVGVPDGWTASSSRAGIVHRPRARALVGDQWQTARALWKTRVESLDDVDAKAMWLRPAPGSRLLP